VIVALMARRTIRNQPIANVPAGCHGGLPQGLVAAVHMRPPGSQSRLFCHLQRQVTAAPS
jgi:hypothetical protein